ncbi:hypothetical protein [Acutalibacter sp. 1XD8-36]|uniref:hypothetical protein n=1 Tax=Acutalibacter sp. 1XD8-36 TaxID=2320852 RepID=UPI00260C31CA|nr:hypothetical protein [Acutalibacter sp. 1XD8-36]
MLLRDRLTKKSGDYCRDECGQDKSCQRLDHAQRHNDISLRCKDALRYERLRDYENTGFSPEEVLELSTKEAYLKMAEEYDAEAEKWERNVETLKAQASAHTGMEESQLISKAMDIRDDMRTNARAMRRRAEKLGEGARK